MMMIMMMLMRRGPMVFAVSVRLSDRSCGIYSSHTKPRHLQPSNCVGACSGVNSIASSAKSLSPGRPPQWTGTSFRKRFLDELESLPVELMLLDRRALSRASISGDCRPTCRDGYDSDMIGARLRKVGDSTCALVAVVLTTEEDIVDCICVCLKRDD